MKICLKFTNQVNGVECDCSNIYAPNDIIMAARIASLPKEEMIAILSLAQTDGRDYAVYVNGEEVLFTDHKIIADMDVAKGAARVRSYLQSLFPR